MTIGTKSLVDCVNASITTAETPMSILQLSSVARDFEQGFVKSVADRLALPSAAENKGRWIYLEDRCSYRWSDGATWTNDFTSTFLSDLRAWGHNERGQLGDTTTIDRSSPVPVVGGFTDWCQVSGGASHSLGRRTNGTAWAWGCNTYGQLGDNTITSRRSPVSVVGGFTDWCQASAGRYHSLGVRTNGTLLTWGLNSSGQLGDNTTTNRSSPVSVFGGFTDWCQASAGNTHSLALRTNGTLWAWGSSLFGQLGAGTSTTVSRSSPVSVVGGFTDWCQVSAGGFHSLAVRANGTLWAWGINQYGRLGDNTVVSKSSPVSVVGGFTDWCQVSGGDTHSLAVRTNGTAWAWGNNVCGVLGDNTTTNKSSPVSVVGGFTDWCQASAGCGHSIGLRSNGTLWAWGCNSRGRLGDNTTTNKSSPVSVVGGFTDWCQVSAGRYHNLGLRYVKGFN